MWFSNDWEARIERFGTFLAKAREAKGIAQKALAQHLNVDSSLICRLEKGELTKLTPDHAERYIQSYPLTEREQYQARGLLFNFLGDQQLLIDDLLTQIQTLLCTDLAPDTYDYFALCYKHKEATLIDPLWAQLSPALGWWTRNEPPRSRAAQMLVLESAALLVHYWDNRGLYATRLRLVGHAVEAAYRLGFEHIGAWLAGDALAWTYTEIHNDLATA